jgi:hypothetical protein
MGERRGVQLDEGEDHEEAERCRNTAHGEREHKAPDDVFVEIMAPHGGDLGDRGVEQVGADRHLGAHSERRDEEGRHQRGTGDAGEADEKPDTGARGDERQHTGHEVQVEHAGLYLLNRA